MRALWVFLLVIIALIAGIIGGVFTNFWLFPKLAEIPAFQEYLQLDQEGHTIVKLIEKEKEVITEDEAIFEALELSKPAMVSVVSQSSVPVDASRLSGTGFFVSADGLVATNKHLIGEGGAELSVIDRKNNVHRAVLVIRDPLSDLALLKVEGDNFPVANLASADSVQPGQRLIVPGSGLGHNAGFVTTGSLSATNRGIASLGSVEMVSRLEGVLEIEALVNKENTGGPVLNYNGQVIGLATDLVGGGQLSYAIPVEILRDVIDKYTDKQSLVRSTLGLHYQTITPDIAHLEKLEVEHGARLQGASGTLAVTIGGPAYRAGLKQGDIITKLNGEDIDFRVGLMTELQEFNPGTEVEVTYWRNGQELKAVVVVGESR